MLSVVFSPDIYGSAGSKFHAAQAGAAAGVCLGGNKSLQCSVCR